jgi:hypothetical protein
MYDVNVSRQTGNEFWQELQFQITLNLNSVGDWQDLTKERAILV